MVAQLPDGRVVPISPEIAAALQEAQEKAAAERSARLDAMGQRLAKTRQTVIDNRRQSGIEDEWDACDDAYAGVDDSNKTKIDGRNRFHKTLAGVAEDKRTDSEQGGSTVFLNITKPYVDAAAARAGDMLLPTDDKFFEIEHTTIPSLILATKTEQMMQLPNGQQVPAAQVAKQMLAEAKLRSEAAYSRIDDWLSECRFTAELRRGLDDAARLGSCVVKGPYPVKSRRMAFVEDAGQGQPGMVIEESIVPESRCIPVRNLYPDYPACGDDIHKGSFVWEYDEISAKKLRDLRGMDGYLDDQIEMVLKEGPMRAMEHDASKSMTSVEDSSRPFELWHFVGDISSEEAEVAGCECPEVETISVMLTMVNNRVIRAARNINDSGKFPYDIMPWKRKAGMPWGSGVAWDVNVPQRLINGCTREMINNLGFSSGPQIVMRQGAIVPADGGDYTLRPRKTWLAKPDADVQDVREAFAAINIPTIQEELMATIQWALKMAEDTSGLPMILQGQMGKAPDTLGGMQMLSNNASGVLRRIARMFDDCVTIPHIQRYYEWLMIYGEDDNEKGDFNIIARGSSALVERELQAQALVNIGQLTLNPVFELSPARYAEELLRSQKINPEKLKLTDEEKQANAERQPPEAPQVSIAKLRAQIDQMEMQWKSQESDKDRQLDLTLEAIRAEVKQAEQQNNRVISLDNIKAIMGKTAIETRNKRDLYVDERNLKIRTGQGI